MHGYAKGSHHQESILVEAGWANKSKWRYHSPSWNFGAEVETQRRNEDQQLIDEAREDSLGWELKIEDEEGK